MSLGADMEALELAVFMLATTPDNQVEFLGERGLPVEALVTEFDERVRHAPEMLAAGVITTEQAEAVLALGTFLERLRGEANAALWTETALHEFGEWLEVRLLAQRALMQFT